MLKIPHGGPDFQVGSCEHGSLRNPQMVLYHGASPGRWARRGSDIGNPRFDRGCFMTPDPDLAAMYAADWSSRADRAEFIQHLIEEAFALGDPEELLAHGFIEGDEESGYRRSWMASAEYVLQHWTAFDISHYLVRRSVRSVHHYPHGALVFPLHLATDDILFYDCGGRHFDDLEGNTFGIDRGPVTTEEVVQRMRGATKAIWFMNLNDSVHATSTTVRDTVYAYDAGDIVFALNGRSGSDDAALCLSRST